MMKNQDMIHMTNKELKRLHFIHKAMEQEITQKETAEACHLSERQVRRIIARVKEEGHKGIINKSRGKPSNRRLKFKDRVIGLYKAKYPDFGPTLASEKLSEKEKINIYPETLRLWLNEAGVGYKTRKKRPHRQWRERKNAFGQMVQMDGSHHDWLEGRGPQLVLMGYIDDATNTVFARFYDYEGTFPAMDGFLGYIKLYGLPQSVYLDKHTTYKSNAKPTLEEELEGKEPKSQFERALEELGVEVIHAHSPQAKGRIERLFGTFQDRLVKELRLAKVKTKDEANRVLERYLRKFNQRFTVEPQSRANLHRKVPKSLDLKRILSIRTLHPLQNDNTIQHRRKIYLLKTQWTRRCPKRILVEERMNGKAYLMDQDKALEYTEVHQRPKKLPQVAPKVRRPRKIAIPPKKHLWRRFVINPPDSKKIPQNGHTSQNSFRLNAARATFQGKGMSTLPKNVELIKSFPLSTTTQGCQETPRKAL